jgi:acyl transferase domain-containing protein/NAD(P)H-dependent flavin oxidoreductase YrpB (nitropropane dioxygenase family)/NAD(P)-dependent dehydrogenase (short-subunit alcohol dehydrogenase family)
MGKHRREAGQIRLETVGVDCESIGALHPMRIDIPRILGLAPRGNAGTAIVVSAGRAGALGLLDLEGIDHRSSAEVVARTAARTPRFGIRIEASRISPDGCIALPEQVRLVCVLTSPGIEWGSIVEAIHRAGRTAIAEVRSVEAATLAEAAGADGLVLAGHEAGGHGSIESSFVLLQGVLARVSLPCWVRGGIGPLSASGCVAGGATGVVLDGALLLTRESPLPEEIRDQVARFDGGESLVLAPKQGEPIRVFGTPGSPALKRLRSSLDASREEWQRAESVAIGWSVDQAWPVGQDAAFALDLSRRYVTVGGVVQAVDKAIDRGIGLAREFTPLGPDSPLAASHKTRYPIVQGPMTRVSDTSAFASAVADGGALPFLALAMLRGPEVKSLLAEAASRLAGRAWGVGVLGFVSPEFRLEQIAEIRAVRPPFALIAGGRPDQAVELEREGIATYLHVPSPGLLSQYLRDGARRFVLEGRECGGHVGPRSSLVLWEQAVGILLEFVEKGGDAESLHLLFAGGIHDARSSATVAALAAPLAAKGGKIGVLIGTAYLFTQEAVTSGAIVPRFQREVVGCRSTVLLETGPGHEVRVGPSPFVEAFAVERARMQAEARSVEEIRTALEGLNAGRLRVAAKGLDRSVGGRSSLVTVDESAQFERGIYMLGQVATLRDQVTTIADLHREISVGGTERIEETSHNVIAEVSKAAPSDIAIIGMSGIFPGAGNLRAFWENTLKGVDAIIEIPPDRWDWRTYYDADPKAPDKIVSKWGGFVPDIPFDPLRYGMPPTSLSSIEPAQLLVLEAVRSALEDAGYEDRPFPRERTAVVLGMGGGAAQLSMGYAFRSYLPMLEAIAPEAGREARTQAEAYLPEWTEDSFPGFLLNVTAGRVANRFDLGGANYTVDAACGSSLAAASLAVRELEMGAADMVILGGADTVQNPFTYLAFSKTQAFSPRGRCRPFDESADGIVISEGVGVVILKRLADAERDGDRIYAVIKGIGASSDGRARGLTAPGAEGQVRALNRAYEKSGIDPTTVGYFEAHGTGTAVGDVVEVNSLSSFLREAGAEADSSVVGSVKSMIGHTKCAAGLAGLINATLALHHKTLPPTIGVDRLNPKADLDGGPLRVNGKARPWFHTNDTAPRHAGVSAFGFGGTNFHAVLESYDSDPIPATAAMHDWPVELLLWRADGFGQIVESLDRIGRSLDAGAQPRLRDLAHSLAARFDQTATNKPTLAIVAKSLAELRQALSLASEAIARDPSEFHDPRGTFYSKSPAFSGMGVAFVFPGQGSQSLEMLGDLAVAFPEVREAFEEFDAALIRQGRLPVTPKIFPATTLNESARDRARHALIATDVAQPAVGAASVGLLRLLASLGVSPDAVAGHSYGELVALHASGALGVESLAILSEARGRFMIEAAGSSPGTMAALSADAEQVASLIAEIDGVVVANRNGPRQTVIAGSRDGITRAVEFARSRGVRAFELPVACAFHSPSVANARGPLERLACELLTASPDRPVFANLDGLPHPTDSSAIARRLGDHLASPVRFSEMIEGMHAAGSRVFVEVGPGSVVTPLVDSILGSARTHLAVSCDAPSRPGISTLLTTLARLCVAGVAVRPARLTSDRACRRIDLDGPLTEGLDLPAASTWLVNGSRARPIGQPEPLRLGQAGLKPAAGPKLSAKSNGTAVDPSRNGSHAELSKKGDHPSRIDRYIMPETREPHPERNGHHGSRIPQAESVTQEIRTPAANGTGAASVIEAFQQTMRTFLEVQQATMLAYLGRQVVTGESARPSAPMPEPPVRAESPKPVQVEKPVAAVPVVEAAPVKEAPPSPVKEAASRSIADRLIGIVRDRTGYPAEMLKLNLDLEADLGIDSIKRVEILGTLRDSVDRLKGSNDGTLMDALSRARTLGEIIERVERAISSDRGAQVKPQPTVKATATAESPVRRLLLEPVEAPLSKERGGLCPGGLLIVTDDGRGVATQLAKTLRGNGHLVEIVGSTNVDLSSPTAVEGLLTGLRDSAPIAGLIHALPLRLSGSAGLGESEWSSRMDTEVKSLFLLARAAANDLERSARLGGACLVAATAMGGGFASVGTAPDMFFPGQGGVAGLVKTLAREWPEVRTRSVDFDISSPISRIVDDLAAEIMTDDGWPEVGYLRGRRVRLHAIAAPLGSRDSAFALTPGEPVIVTGGARGITAVVAAELARRWQPTLLLIGSSPLPTEDEDAATTTLNSPAEIKAVLHDQLRHKGRDIGPADLERAFRSLRNAREIRETLRILRAAGSTVDYVRADVRDRASLANTLARWRERFGAPVGLIHGAGIIHDKLLRDKTPDAFDRVLGTKLDGALNLARLVSPETLRFAAFFSSIAGRFGNGGQSDYAAANEALNKLAIWLDRRWACRVVSINWGPWSGVGMVTELEEHLGRRGLGMIPPRAGCAAFVDELTSGRKGQVEVVLAGELGSLAGPLGRATLAAGAVQ